MAIQVVCDVAVYVRGRYGLRVVIDDVGATAEAAPDIAKQWAVDCLQALAAVPASEWQTRVLAVREQQDLHPKDPTEPQP